MDRESKLVQRIARVFRPSQGTKPGAGLRLGLGDDAAIISSGGKNDWVLSCDAFLEGVHFLSNIHPADSVGYKALVRATSDLAAMGATPRYFLLTLAIPANRTGTWLTQFLNGLSRAARGMRMFLIGGDTTKSGLVSIGITVVGEIAGGYAVTRGGAKPDDIIYVSGKLGRAQLGLELLTQGNDKAQGRRSRRSGDAGWRQQVLQPHLYPDIKLALGAWLAKRRLASAMIDISDGLSTDLNRLCIASGVGAQIRASLIPSFEISEELLELRGKVRFDPLKMALHGGEDYELLFTVSPRNSNKLRAAPGFSQLRAIGEVTRRKKMILIGLDGRKAPLEPKGWDPFRR